MGRIALHLYGARRATPSPMLTGKISYWYASDVFGWVWEQGIGEIPESELDCLIAIKALIIATEEKKCPEIVESFTRMVASG